MTEIVDNLNSSQVAQNLQIISEGYELKQEPFIDKPQYNLDLNTA